MSEIFQPYCSNCDKEVDCYIEEQPYTHNLKGKDYTFLAKYAFCSECHSKLFHNDAHDYNIDALYDLYRQDHNLISRSEIREICDIYKIDKKPLSLLLGWSEVAFPRYYNGLVPPTEYSDILKKSSL